MSDHDEQRRRRRGVWWLVGISAVVMLGATGSVIVLRDGNGDVHHHAKRAKTRSFAIVSPPVATSTTGTASTTRTATTAGTGAREGDSAEGDGRGNSGHGADAGHAAGAVPPGHAITATFAGATPVAPGQAGRITIRVENPNNQDVLLTGVATTISGISRGADPALPHCEKSWFAIGDLTGTPRVAARGSAQVTLPVTMTDEHGVNQDNCKGATYRFSFTVNGRQA